MKYVSDNLVLIALLIATLLMLALLAIVPIPCACRFAAPSS
jgi:hypothetical protein